VNNSWWRREVGPPWFLVKLRVSLIPKRERCGTPYSTKPLVGKV
jgi:hypothetical protein